MLKWRSCELKKVQKIKNKWKYDERNNTKLMEELFTVTKNAFLFYLFFVFLWTWHIIYYIDFKNYVVDLPEDQDEPALISLYKSCSAVLLIRQIHVKR